MAARGRALIGVGAGAAMSLLPLGLFLPEMLGMSAMTITVVAGSLFYWLLQWAITPPRDDEPRLRVLSRFPKPALVALWIAPWVVVLSLVFFAPQIEAATGKNVQSMALFMLFGFAWLALTVAVIAAAIGNLHRVRRPHLTDQG